MELILKTLELGGIIVQDVFYFAKGLFGCHLCLKTAFENNKEKCLFSQINIPTISYPS